MNHIKRQLANHYGTLIKSVFGSQPLVFVSINLDLTAMRRAVTKSDRLSLSDELLTAIRNSNRQDAITIFYRKFFHRVSNEFYGSAHRRFGRRLKYIGVMENSGKCYNRTESPYDGHFLIAIPTEGHQTFMECVRKVFERSVYAPTAVTIDWRSVIELSSELAEYHFKQFVSAEIATERLIIPI